MRIILCLTCLLLAACGSTYQGYKFKPYTVRGVDYAPMAPHEAVGCVIEGLASHYDESFLVFFPGKTSIGEKQYSWSHSAAHKTLPLPCKVRVTNLRNGRSVVVRVNDRGPFVEGRELDVTTGVPSNWASEMPGSAPFASRSSVSATGAGGSGGNGKWATSGPSNRAPAHCLARLQILRRWLTIAPPGPKFPRLCHFQRLD